MTCINCAIVLAQKGSRVPLIDSHHASWNSRNTGYRAENRPYERTDWKRHTSASDCTIASSSKFIGTPRWHAASKSSRVAGL